MTTPITLTVAHKILFHRCSLNEITKSVLKYLHRVLSQSVSLRHSRRLPWRLVQIFRTKQIFISLSSHLKEQNLIHVY